MSIELVQLALRDERVQAEVHGPARAILIVLAEHANKRTGQAWPSRETIAAESGWQKTAVDNAIRELVALGFIEAVGYRQSCRVWKLTFTSPRDGEVTSTSTSPPNGEVTEPTSPSLHRDLTATSPRDGDKPEPGPKPTPPSTSRRDV